MGKRGKGVGNAATQKQPFPLLRERQLGNKLTESHAKNIYIRKTKTSYQLLPAPASLSLCDSHPSLSLTHTIGISAFILQLLQGDPALFTPQIHIFP